jgi:dipeptidyl aminopeptidase/acylaminoacyl peptidase
VRIILLGLAAIISIAVVAVRGSDLRCRNVTFRGNGIPIAATIYEPRAPGRYPALVFAGGSAPFKRGLYALWAEHLARKGIIAIVPDKRGVGGTGGEFERNNNTSKANLDLLAGDATAALRFAAHQPNVDSLRLGLLGISQGGWTVPMAAVSTPLARFMVMITGPSVSVREEGAWSDLMGDDQRAAKLTRAEAERVIDTIAAGGVDARSRLASLSTPGLWLFGSEDASIPTRKSVAVLDSLNRTLGKRFSYFVAPGCGHLVLCRDTGLLPKVAPSAWKALDDWLAQTVR